MPKPLSKDERELARKIRKCLRAKAKGKLFYDEADKLLNELLTEADTDKSYRMVRSGKKMASFQDNFAESNTCFRAHGIKRFELVVKEVL